MKWQLYQLRFRLLSPLHVGRGKVGNIQFTRPYVMARQMWGALTVKLTRMAQCGEWKPPNDVILGDYVYVRMGEQVGQQITFSYFYPEDENAKPLFPRFTDKGLMYGADGHDLTADIFAWRYLNSYASTALNYELNSAEEGTLHETEFLAPHTRRDGKIGSHEVFLTGYIFVRSDCSLPWEAALREIQIGGERKSGWGRMRLCGEPTETQPKLFDLLECDLEKSRPEVHISAGKPLLAHTQVHEPNDPNKTSLQVTGDIEPLVSRAWAKDKGAGQQIELVAVCFSPGSVLNQPQDSWFAFSENNIWAIS